ncbi:MAG: hypothetical protein AAF899_00365 [Pseudomonadota bacterium]
MVPLLDMVMALGPAWAAGLVRPVGGGLFVALLVGVEYKSRLDRRDRRSGRNGER